MKKADGTHIVGIDLGTTYSLVADIQDGAPVVLPNAMGELLTPSAVSVDDDGTILVGTAARARAIRFPESSALSFKRDMGTDRTTMLGGQCFTPVELSGLVLRQLKADAESLLGATISEAVITVPAYFGDAQRQATRDAARLAGLTAERIINEPTAASLAYGFHRRTESACIAVLDLGGGTFDVTILQVTAGVIEALASAGDVRLGGDDFTRVLVEAAAVACQLDLGDRLVASVLFDAAEHLKRALSTRLQASAKVVLADKHLVDLSFTRADIEHHWRPLLARLEAPIRQALLDAHLATAQIDGVLLVGGAARMPCVTELAARLFGRTPKTSLPQDEAVALGAAVQAALKIGDASVEDLVSTDIAPFSLGIAVSEELRRSRVDDIFAPILERGTVLPASRSKVFSTTHPMQTALHIQVFQGEHSVISRNKALGEYFLEGLPPGRINPVEVRFTYDLNGILEVETTVLATGMKKSLIITNGAGRLTAEQLEASRQRLATLKIHPRETLPNRTAIELAESLFASQLGEEREAIGNMLTMFRLALAVEDRERIEVARKQLLAFVSAFKNRETP